MVEAACETGQCWHVPVDGRGPFQQAWGMCRNHASALGPPKVVKPFPDYTVQLSAKRRDRGSHVTRCHNP